MGLWLASKSHIRGNIDASRRQPSLRPGQTKEDIIFLVWPGTFPFDVLRICIGRKRMHSMWMHNDPTSAAHSCWEGVYRLHGLQRGLLQWLKLKSGIYGRNASDPFQ